MGNPNPSAEIHIGNPLIDDIRNTLIITRSGIGIGTDDLSNVDANLYNLDGGCLFGSVGIGTTTITNEDTNFYVVGNSEFYGNARITGVTTSQNGFTSGIGVTNPVKITVSGNILTFTVTGVGSTSLTLY